MSDFNPYAAPRQDVSTTAGNALDESGCWQDGAMLIMTKDAELPDRCVKCNLPAEGYRLKRNLSWHRPGWYLFILMNVLVYIIVAMIVRYTAKIKVGLCKRHRQKRIRAILIGWLAPILGIVVIIAAVQSRTANPDMAPGAALGTLLGIGLIFGGILYGVFGSRVVLPKKIDKRYVWLKNIHPDYLATLPVRVD